MILFRLLFSIITTLFILRKAYAKRSLSKSGCIAAFFVGSIITLSSFSHFLCLLTFFYAGSKATKFKQETKKSIEDDFKVDGQRDAVQVLCNGFMSTFFSALYLMDCGHGERPIDFSYDYKSTWYSIAVIASFACCCGDTLASELGTVLVKRKTVLHLIKFRSVPKGTNGGVTVIGTIFSIVGGFMIGFSYYLPIKILISFRIIDLESFMHPQWPVLIIGAFSGFIGSLIDSILGGFLQYSGYNKKTNKIVNIKTNDPNVEHISGYNILTNNQVNFLSSIITSFLVPSLAFEAYKYI